MPSVAPLGFTTLGAASFDLSYTWFSDRAAREIAQGGPDKIEGFDNPEVILPTARQDAFTALQHCLYTGKIKGYCLTDDGHIFEIAAHFWASKNDINDEFIDYWLVDQVPSIPLMTIANEKLIGRPILKIADLINLKSLNPHTINLNYDAVSGNLPVRSSKQAPNRRRKKKEKFDFVIDFITDNRIDVNRITQQKLTILVNTKYSGNDGIHESTVKRALKSMRDNPGLYTSVRTQSVS